MSGLESIIGQLIVEFGYSRTIYPEIAKYIGNFTDKVPFSISEISAYALIGAAVAIPSYYGIKKLYKTLKRRKENDTLHFHDIFIDYKESFRRAKYRTIDAVKRFGYNIKYHTKQTFRRIGLRAAKTVGVLVLSATILAGIGAGTVLAYEGVYGLNYYRVPIEEKLNLQLEAPSQNTLIMFAYHLAYNINEDMYLKDKEPSFTPFEIGGIINKGVDDIIYSIDGIKVNSSHRVKTAFLREIFTFMRADAYTNPLIHEIVYDDRQQEYNMGFDAGHEISQLKGYPKENEADFIGYLACMNSGYAQIRLGAERKLFIIALNYIDSKQIRALLNNRLSLKAKENFDRDNRLASEKIEKSNKTWNELYDDSLKAQGIPEGIENYNKVLLDVLAYEYVKN